MHGWVEALERGNLNSLVYYEGGGRIFPNCSVASQTGSGGGRAATCLPITPPLRPPIHQYSISLFIETSWTVCLGLSVIFPLAGFSVLSIKLHTDAGEMAQRLEHRLEHLSWIPRTHMNDGSRPSLTPLPGELMPF